MLERIRHATEFSLFTRKLSNIEGWLTPLEGYTLSTMARFGPGLGEIVEIGSYMGLSTCWLALGSKSALRERVTAIDHFKGSPEQHRGGFAESSQIVKNGSTLPAFNQNLASINATDWVNVITSSSEEAVNTWNKPIRLLFIDADHSYEGVKKDFELWSPFLIQGGLVGFHDCGNPNYPGVTRLCHELAVNTNNFTEIAGADSVRVFQHTP